MEPQATNYNFPGNGGAAAAPQPNDPSTANAPAEGAPAGVVLQQAPAPPGMDGSSIAGYPSLMQQYFHQQQQLQHQHAYQQQYQQQQQQQYQQHQQQQQQLSMAGYNAANAGGVMNGGTGYDVSQLLLLQQQLQQQHQLMGLDGGALFHQQQAASPGIVAGMAPQQAEGSYEGLLAPWSATSAGLMGNMTTAEKVVPAKKTRKKPKDKPKRPLSAYNCFFRAERARILAQITKEKEEKKKEESEAKEEEEKKEGDEKEETSTEPKDGEEEKNKDSEGDEKEDSKTADPNATKKRPHGKIGFESLAKTIGQRWQELSKEEAAIYKEMADKDMKRYKGEMELYLRKQRGEISVPEVALTPPDVAGLVAANANAAGVNLYAGQGQVAKTEPQE